MGQILAAAVPAILSMGQARLAELRALPRAQQDAQIQAWILKARRSSPLLYLIPKSKLTSPAVIDAVRQQVLRHGDAALSAGATAVKKNRRRNGQDSAVVAQEILRQLGGNRFLMMTGAKNLMRGSAEKQGRPYLSFQVPTRGAKVPNFVRITLDPSDTYTVEFGRIHGFKFTILSTHSDIYADALRGLIERKTGLATRLNGRARRNPFTANDAWGVITTDAHGHVIKDQGFYQGDNAQAGAREAVEDLRAANRDGRVYLLKVEQVTPVKARTWKERAHAKARAAAEGASKDFTRLAGSLTSWARRNSGYAIGDVVLFKRGTKEIPTIGKVVAVFPTGSYSVVWDFDGRPAVVTVKPGAIVRKAEANPAIRVPGKLKKLRAKARQKRRDLVTTAGGPGGMGYSAYASEWKWRANRRKAR